MPTINSKCVTGSENDNNPFQCQCSTICRFCNHIFTILGDRNTCAGCAKTLLCDHTNCVRIICGDLDTKRCDNCRLFIYYNMGAYNLDLLERLVYFDS